MASHIPLSPELKRLVREQLASGRYQSETEVIQAALRQMEERSGSSNASPDTVFGLWSGREQDGLAYQRALRAEWGH